MFQCEEVLVRLGFCKNEKGRKREKEKGREREILQLDANRKRCDEEKIIQALSSFFLFLLLISFQILEEISTQD